MEAKQNKIATSSEKIDCRSGKQPQFSWMNIRPFLNLVLILSMIILWTSCSTTRKLPEGELLYTGIKKTQVINRDETRAGQAALSEVEAAIACAPNNAIPGSSRRRFPFPMGLWIYNDFVKYKKGIGKWIFNKLAAKPVYVTTVNPEVRMKIATNLLRDYGYFNGTVTYEVLPYKKRKAKIKYTIDMKQPYIIDSVMYLRYNARADSLVRASMPQRLLRKGENFSVVRLDSERQRLSTLFRNQGFFYFRPDFITFRADTLQQPGKVSIQVLPEPGLPKSALRPWHMGHTSVYLTGYNGQQPTDSVRYRNIMIHYSGEKPEVRPAILYNRLKYRPGSLYSQQEQQYSQESLNRLGIFRYAEFQYTPRDTLNICDTLDLRVNAAFDLPLDGELELNVTSKSNDQIGPGAVFNLAKKNMFRGGETFSVKLRGSYEWQTNASVEGKSSVINSYELGISSSLDFPRVVFPGFSNRIFNYPASTTFRLYADQMNRARFFKLLAFGGNISYNFRPTTTKQHAITPFRLTFNVLQSKTERFDSITKANPALYLSLQNQFVPAMSYAYTYDNAMIASKQNHTWWETSITSAGNLTSSLYAIFGQSFKEKDKKLLGNPFAQFLKLTSEIRYNYRINAKQRLAMRLMGGVLYTYGNSLVAPYSDQFYIGGANSVRAFTVRSLGPGSYHPKSRNAYSYIDQTGDLKLEANIEYRFKLVGDFYGATFLDAGNIWLIRNDPSRPGGQFSLKNFGKDIALGTGVGLRYDLTFLVIRFDLGIGIHAPYETSRKGYYNIPKFKDGLGLHFAIGYPF